ncbi:hypothetical protein [Sphingomonas hankookensis]|uniref:hypothetical protein n=1 Tax=Sphingomonas hankookensis TaxID=563996 RepID=UPI003D30295D
MKSITKLLTTSCLATMLAGTAHAQTGIPADAPTPGAKLRRKARSPMARRSS